MSVAKPDPALVDKLVVANRILYDQDVVDGFGHISVRHDSVPGVFLLSCNRAPGLVVRGDIDCFDLDGANVSDSRNRPYLERFIHSEIYRARADVVAVVHSHSPSVIPFGVTGARLKPIFHMAGFLGGGAAHYDIRDASGNTDLLVRNSELGKYLATALGPHSCVLMRGHGSTTVGASIEQVVYRAIYAEVNARLQSQALGLGAVNYLSEEEAQLAAAAIDGQIGRCWDLWQRRIGPIAS